MTLGFFFFDPVYMIVMIIGMALSGLAALLVKTTFAKYSRHTTRSGMTGSDVARAILRDNDIYDVKVEQVAGNLSDHYDPTSKTLRLSESVYSSRSMAAFGVAAHEVGHAIQHAKAYAPLKLRSAWVPVANLGSGLSIVVLIAAMFLGGFHSEGGLGPIVGTLGLCLFGCTAVFSLITLPVEFDASKRALITLEQGNYATADEIAGARKVLNAAALTYVAAFVTSLLMLLYWAYRLGLFGRNNN